MKEKPVQKVFFFCAASPLKGELDVRGWEADDFMPLKLKVKWYYINSSINHFVNPLILLGLSYFTIFKILIYS
jgi:hypothetical protein